MQYYLFWLHIIKHVFALQPLQHLYTQDLCKIIKNEVGCMILLKTVDTRSPCEVRLKAYSNLPQPLKTEMYNIIERGLQKIVVLCL